MNFQVLDHFYRSSKYGFVFEITTPQKVNAFSIALEYPPGSTNSNLQTWNLEYYGFYDDYVLFHSRKEALRTPGDNHQKHVIVMDGLDTNALPKFHLFDRVIK